MISEEEWSRMKDFLEKLLKLKIRSRKIKGIRVNPRNRWQPQMYIEVGKSYEALEPGSPPDKIIAIFETTVFCVCSRTRGGGKGMPYIFHRDDVMEVKDYDSAGN